MQEFTLRDLPVTITTHSPEETEADIVVIRNGEKITLHDVKFPTQASNGAMFGSYDFAVYGEKADFGSLMKHTFFRSGSTVKVIIDSLKDLIGGRYGADAVSGPIGMAEAVGQATKTGIYSLLYLFTLITMNLGVFNLLPFPALDGGRFFFLLIEANRTDALCEVLNQYELSYNEEKNIAVFFALRH